MASLRHLRERIHDQAAYPDAQGTMRGDWVLEPYQKSALAWMLQRELAQPSGGILADDQGLVRSELHMLHL